MRYILNSEGYIADVSFGAEISCSLGNCTEYTGEIPTGYSTIEEWHDEELDRLNAWKIVNGNLLYDSIKASELEAISSEQEKNNRHITKQELDTALADIGQAGSIEASNSDEISFMILPKKTATGRVIQLNDSSTYEVPYIEVESNAEVTNEITLISSTSNLLPNEAITQTISGLTATIKQNKSVVFSGTIQNSGVLTIAGTRTSTTALFAIKADQPYYISILPAGMLWNLYNYDGTDRELIYSGTGGLITLTENKAITNVEISWDNQGEAVAINEVIYPMLNVGDTAKEYEVHKSNKTIINLDNNDFTSNIVINDGNCKLGSTSLSIDRVINTYKFNTVIYAFEDVSLNINYLKCDLYERVKKTAEYAFEGYYDYVNLTLYNSYASTTAIQKIRLTNFTLHKNMYAQIVCHNCEDVNSSTFERVIYNIYFKEDLRTYNNISDELIIENGTAYIIRKVGVNENGEMYILDSEAKEYATKILAGFNHDSLSEVDSVYIQTWDDQTIILAGAISNKSQFTCEIEYMLKSTFTDIFCTIIEKNASIKVLEDMIKLEVTRASEAEGELQSSITLEADKISQIVSAVGDEDEQVTPASIVSSINEASSNIKISADHIDIEGTEFPRVASSNGDNYIEALDGNAGIQYDAFVHKFLGTIGIILDNGDNFNHAFQVYGTNNVSLINANDDGVVLGHGDDTHVSLNGKIYINGEAFDGTAKFG